MSKMKQDLAKHKRKMLRKQLARVLKQREGREALRDLTGLDLRFVSDAQKERTALPLVAILSPSYKARVGMAWDAVEKMIMHSRGVCQPFVEPRFSQSVVHWARNYGLSMLLQSRKPFDYVLFIDDDIAPPVDALVKLLAHRKDFVGAACTVRVDPAVPNFRTLTAHDMQYHPCMEWSPDQLIGSTGHSVGAGMILISRNCLERVGEYYINCEYEKKYYGLAGDKLERLQNGRAATAKQTADFWWFEFLEHPHGSGEYGEDISFCFKMRELGIPTFIDTSVQPGHYGDYAFSIPDYLAARGSILEQMMQEQAQEQLLGIPDSETAGVEVTAAALLDAPMQEVS